DTQGRPLVHGGRDCSRSSTSPAPAGDVPPARRRAPAPRPSACRPPLPTNGVCRKQGVCFRGWKLFSRGTTTRSVRRPADRKGNRTRPMVIPGIKSRPVHTTLQPDPGGRHHLLVGQGSGGAALLRLLARMPPGADTRVLYTGPMPPGVVE